MEKQDINLQRYLEDFSFPYPETDDPNEHEEARQRLQEECFQFLEHLGYDSDDIFRNVTISVDEPSEEYLTLPNELEFDYIIGRSPASTPYIIADTYLGSEAEITHHYKGIRPNSFVAEYIKFFPRVDCHYFVIFSNEFIVISKPNGLIDAYSYTEINKSEIGKIKDALEPPKKFPDGPISPAAFHPNQTKLIDYEVPPFPNTPRSEAVVEEKNFKLDLVEYSNALREANRANSPIEKGNSLEHLVKVLFEGISCLSIKDTNVVTRSGEIDLIIEYDGADELTLFDYHDRFLLVECKNRIDPVPAKEVGHFETKLAKTNTELGVLFAWSGISGEDRDEHAHRIIDSAPNDRPTIIVFDERDLYRIAEGKNFYDMIDSKLYRRRFDL